MRIGHGFDVHRFSDEPAAGAHIVLGGVRIPSSKTLLAHSDGDVLLHAVCDALLGALALGDIGHHFPPGDSHWKNADSRYLLRLVLEKIHQAGWQPGNVDCTVVCETPRIKPHVAAMRQCMASDLQCDENRISIKATTTEGLGYTGRREGIAAHVVCLLMPRPMS